MRQEAGGQWDRQCSLFSLSMSWMADCCSLWSQVPAAAAAVAAAHRVLPWSSFPGARALLTDRPPQRRVQEQRNSRRDTTTYSLHPSSLRLSARILGVHVRELGAGVELTCPQWWGQSHSPWLTGV